MKEMRSSGLIIIREDIGTKFIPGIHLFITKETLDRLSKEDIVAGCLYELTFFGFNENKVLGKRDKMVDDIKKMRNKIGVD